MLQSRRLHAGVVVAAIGLASLMGIGRENRASLLARLSAWNRRQLQRLERQAERQARAVKGDGRWRVRGC
jgi:hypothetical protein